MRIRAGYEITYQCPQNTPMILMLSVHPSRDCDLVTPDRMTLDPPMLASEYVDGFGNKCTRILAPAGQVRIASEFVIDDSGEPDVVVANAGQHDLHHLPANVLVYLLGSRYCETDKLLAAAWSLFQDTPKGWILVQKICDFVHDHLTFGYEHARVTRTAWDAFVEKKGVCRDFAHLAITLCRCMNIPARYCTGYLGDIGVPPVDEPMDFSAWFEVYLGRHWYTFDARHNQPRIGRVLMARGRDATDVAIVTSFGPCTMSTFKVTTDEVPVDEVVVPRRRAASP